MTDGLDDRVSRWVMAMDVIKDGLVRYEHDPLVRPGYEMAFCDLLLDAGVFPSHVWKPYVHFYARYQGW